MYVCWQISWDHNGILGRVTHWCHHFHGCEKLENPRGILVALNSIGNLCWWPDFCPWKHCSKMCALAAFPIFCCGIVVFFVGVLLCLILFGHVFLCIFFGLWNFCLDFVGIVTVFSPGWLIGSVPGWPIENFNVMCLLHFVGFCVIVWNLWDYCGVCFWFAQNRIIEFWMRF